MNSLSNHVADLGALIAQLKATPAHLVGNSYGAYVALALAIAHPELVRGLVLGETGVLPLLPRTSVGKGVQQSFMTRGHRGIAEGVRGREPGGRCESVHGRHLCEPRVFR